jgi:hypothetical protein
MLGTVAQLVFGVSKMGGTMAALCRAGATRDGRHCEGAAGSFENHLAATNFGGHSLIMTANTLSVPLPDYFGRVEAHFLREFSAAVEDWSRCVNVLTAWEDEHLLDVPTPELLAAHKQTIERLLRFGRFISLATQPSEFPDRKVADIVASTQSCLKDKLALWHGPKLSKERREQILKACFKEP